MVATNSKQNPHAASVTLSTEVGAASFTRQAGSHTVLLGSWVGRQQAAAHLSGRHRPPAATRHAARCLHSLLAPVVRCTLHLCAVLTCLVCRRARGAASLGAACALAPRTTRVRGLLFWVICYVAAHACRASSEGRSQASCQWLGCCIAGPCCGLQLLRGICCLPLLALATPLATHHAAAILHSMPHTTLAPTRILCPTPCSLPHTHGQHD